MWLVKHGDLETVKYLVEHGADVHARNDMGQGAWSLSTGNLEVKKYLTDEIRISR